MKPNKTLIRCSSADELIDVIPEKILENWIREFGGETTLYNSLARMYEKLKKRESCYYCSKRELLLLTRTWLDKEKRCDN